LNGANVFIVYATSPNAPTLTAMRPDGTSSSNSLNICNGEQTVLTTNCANNAVSVWYGGVNPYSSTGIDHYVTTTSTTTYTAKCQLGSCLSANSPPVKIVNEPNIQSTKSGNWQDPTIWANSVVPINCQTVIIQTGHTVTVPINDAKAKSIIIRGNLNFQNVSPTVKGKVSLGI
jgi:hypothetical protein